MQGDIKVMGQHIKLAVPKIMSKAKVIDPIPNYKIIDQAMVDEEQWYTVRAYRVPIMEWVRASNKDWWYEHQHNGRHGIRFDMHEKLFTLFALRWEIK